MFEFTSSERKIAVAGAIMFAVAPALGCSLGDDNLPFATFSTSGEEPEAFLGGELILDSGCLAVRDDNAQETPLVFDRSAEWHESGRVTLTGVEAEVGSWVELGGGVSQVHDWEPEYCYGQQSPFMVYRILDGDGEPANSP